MVCYAVNQNQLKPDGGNSGAIPSCVATLSGFFIGDKTMKQIPLTQGQIALIDDEDFARISKHKWCASRTRYNTFQAVRGKLGKTILMHRQIMKAPIGLVVDHINHNQLDNRRVNLRLATISQNCMNQRPQKKLLSSCFKGVYRHKIYKTWTAYITKDGKRIYIGAFGSEIEAAKAYDKAAKELFGEFAHLNL